MKYKLSIFCLFLLIGGCNDTHNNSDQKEKNEPQEISKDDNNIIKTEGYKTVLSGKVSEYNSFIGLQIELGWVDSHNYSISVFKHEVEHDLKINELNCTGSSCNLPITADTFQKVSEVIKVRMEEEVASTFGAMNAYRIMIKNEENTHVPIEEVSSSEFLRKWAYKRSEKNGPNCYHSALATSGILPLDNPYFVSEDEFTNHLTQSFHEISKLEKFGDLVVLFSDSITHAAFFIGRDQDDREIVFTKNGKVDGYYLFMDLKELMTHDYAYKDTTAKFYSRN